jgi:hypothetical protein
LEPQEPDDGPLDPELEALPEPRRPWRKTTLATMAITAAAAASVAWSLREPAAFAVFRGPPVELGSLTHVQPAAAVDNAWVHGEGTLGPRSIEYERPVDRDRYRVAPLEDNPRVWVELRVPGGLESEHYVAPNSFVGRFVPFEKVGLRHTALMSAIETTFGKPPASDAWLLIDGEAPATTNWAVGLVALFVAFALFNVWGIVHLLRPGATAHR